LSTAGDAGDRELEDVEDAAGRFLGLAEVLLTQVLSAGPFLCFGSLAAAPWRGPTGSAAAATALTWSPVGAELLCSA